MAAVRPAAHRIVRRLKLGTTLLGLAIGADSLPTPELGSCAPSAWAQHAKGRLIVLPGVGNTRFHLEGFVTRIERQSPHLEVEVRPWGVPLLALHNLRAEQRNLGVAAELAAEIAAWRRAHPDELMYLLGYSGGGGIATLVAAGLPEDVSIDRLVLVAPAISPDYPLAERVLPHVEDFVVNYASARDLQVGWGTRVFGTIDRVEAESAGAVGFASASPRVLQWTWTPAELGLGHRGNHLSYLGRRWQTARLLPALDPGSRARDIRRAWSRRCGGL